MFQFAALFDALPRQAIDPNITEVDTSEYEDYTATSEGCHCWWDRSRQSIDPATNEAYSCACCKNGGRQCGYPMHMYCHLPNSTLPIGCKGIKNQDFTLSEKGHPCHFNHDSHDCAWCVDGKTASVDA